MAQFIIITKRNVLRVEGKSMAHVTQACTAVKIRALSVTELNEEEN